MTDLQKHENRITDLEMTVTHLQKDFESLNEVVLEQGKLIEQYARQIQSLVSRVETNEAGPEVRDPLEEKPPHY